MRTLREFESALGEANRRRHQLSDALDGVASTFGEFMTAEAGSHFTCGEADALARALVVAGHRDAAITWLNGHAEGDEIDDLHFVHDPDDPNDAGRVLNEDEIAQYVDELV
ncbi:hypothetical protein ABZY93_22240 [Streptomyces smyrnaeus]|uniref:hypothetical protein n=1 Tax=Streptomyces smyrnaeus TaxID=1387713 RepID=UPI0033AE19DE